MSFDTLTYSKDLVEAGEKPEVAEVHALAINKLVDDDLVTKNHLDIRLKELSNELRTEMATQSNELRTEIATQSNALKMEMKQLQHDLTLKLGGLMVTGIGVLAILMKVL